ncbi:dTDP-4-dehydrorhamnose 3,5-epimerase family protein [Beggiatoa leptomitoformis]|nr:dTDP-4-dehydrorhamnose 3,5-epimerase family protein [Beggiatoa leptomitoformis]
MSAFYHVESTRGIRWDSPLVGIQWLIENPIISERDGGF